MIKSTSKYLLLLLILSITGNAFAQWPADTIWSPAVPSTIPQPAYLSPVMDPDYNIEITRVSDADAFGFPNGSGELQHHYAKTQAWNADMSKLFIGFTNVLNGDDYSISKRISNPGGYFQDARWSNTDPNIRYFCWGENFLKINIETDKIDTLATFEGYDATIGPWEGHLTADDHYVVITNSAGDHASVYDIANDTILVSKAFESFDWISFTPSGDYIAMSNNATGNTELYDLNLNYLRDAAPNQQHADFAVDVDGNEVFVQVIPLSMTRLDNGEVTDLLRDATVCGWAHHNPNLSGHISGRNFDFPGWALVSVPAYECGNGNGYYSGTELFAIKLDTTETIKHFGFSRGKNVAAIASISRDGQKVIFLSDWEFNGTAGGNRYSYVASVPALDNVSVANPLQDLSSGGITVFPNPTQSEMTLKVSLLANENTTLSIYNLLGQEVAVLIDDYRSAGEHTISLETANLPAGLYFCRLSAGGQQIVKMFTVLH